MCLCVCVCVYIYIYICVCVCVCVYIYTHTHMMCVCVCVYVDIYIYTHTHTHQLISLPFEEVRNEGNVLFNDTLNTFYLQLYGVRHMVKDHSDSEKGNPMLPHGLLFPISSMGSFICIIPQTG